MAGKKRPRRRADPERLSGRSRQVMGILYRLGGATATEILEEAPDIPSYSAVRSILRQLVDKGSVTFVEKGSSYFYTPTAPRESRSRSALQHVLETFFGGSAEVTMKALLDITTSNDYDVDLDELERLIQEARREGR